MDVDDAVCGRAGLAGARWLLTGPPYTALQELLHTMLERPATATVSRPTRAKWKPGRRLTACFDISASGPRPEQRETRPARATWTAGAGELPVSSAEESSGPSPPFRVLTATLPRWNMRLEVAPFDPRFPQLGRLFEGRCAAEIAGFDDVRVRWVRYRPGQRHIIHYQAGRGAWEAYAKLYRAGRSKACFETARDLSCRLAAPGADVGCLAPLCHIAGDDAVLFPAVRGMPVSRMLGDGGAMLGGLLESAGSALRLIQQTPAPVSCRRVACEPSAEVAAVRKPAKFFAAVLPETAALFDRLLDRALGIREKLGEEPATFCHGDYKTDHVWVEPRGLTLIDLDSCRIADPAIDAANFLADLGWWFRELRLSGLGQARSMFLDGYSPPAERLRRIRFYEALFDVRLSTHRLPLLSDGWPAAVQAMADRFQTALNNLN